jgi:hypothetical protein
MMSKNSPPPETTHRWKLALVITTLSIAGIAMVAILAIYFSTNKETATQNVLSSVLPLFAAWVSTVLAYYYSSESIEAATQSVKDLMSPEEKLKTILVAEKMIKIHEMIYCTYDENLKVREVLDKLKNAGKGDRIPFLSNEKNVQFILHRSAINEALVECLSKQEDISKLTFKDLFEKVEGLKELADGSFGIVAERATLADAKAEMQRVKDALDVFVTDNGHKDGAVVGWVTNRIVEQSSRI